MKISHIPGAEVPVKFPLTIKPSTKELLDQYKKACEQSSGKTVPLRPLVERMLLDFMELDKDFQRFLREQGGHFSSEHEQATHARAEPSDRSSIVSM